ncbi:MAG: arginine N-succinyltransferase [Phycisphaeraceae bacterium]|nr:arginine N-succinyltransferase [Phycisphaeraceae bacterium]
MFVIRQVATEDVTTLLKLARMVHFINLPPDRDIIASKVVRSRKSFGRQATEPRERNFMFVLEDLDTGNVIGTSAIISCVSWPGHPHVYLDVTRREFWSDDLQQGATQVVLTLGEDVSGPSEMGGLILAPGYRGHAEKLGGFLSMVRFHYMGLHKRQFSKRVIAEMMGAITPDSHNLFWDYLGRRFINLSYKEADLFCQHSKEFMTALFPREPFYASLLPAEARNLIGRESDETRPARRMLERQGFEYKGHIDPFDGGPYLEVARDKIPLVTATQKCSLTGELTGTGKSVGIVSHESDIGFRAVRTTFTHRGDGIRIPAAAMDAIHAVKGSKLGVTALPNRSGTKSGTKSGTAAGTIAKPASKSKTASKSSTPSKSKPASKSKTGSKSGSRSKSTK